MLLDVRSEKSINVIRFDTSIEVKAPAVQRMGQNIPGDVIYGERITHDLPAVPNGTFSLGAILYQRDKDKRDGHVGISNIQLESFSHAYFKFSVELVCLVSCLILSMDDQSSSAVAKKLKKNPLVKSLRDLIKRPRSAASQPNSTRDSCFCLFSI